MGSPLPSGAASARRCAGTTPNTARRHPVRPGPASGRRISRKAGSGPGRPRDSAGSVPVGTAGSTRIQTCFRTEGRRADHVRGPRNPNDAVGGQSLPPMAGRHVQDLRVEGVAAARRAWPAAPWARLGADPRDAALPLGLHTAAGAATAGVLTGLIDSAAAGSVPTVLRPRRSCWCRPCCRPDGRRGARRGCATAVAEQRLGSRPVSTETAEAPLARVRAGGVGPHPPRPGAAHPGRALALGRVRHGRDPLGAARQPTSLMVSSACRK